MIQVCTPFSTSFGNVWTVSKFWTPHDEILRGKTKSRNSPPNKARSAWFARFAWSVRSASLHFSMTVVAWMRALKAIYAIWNGFSANGFWVHSFARFWIPKAGFWIPIPSIPDSTCKNFLDSGIRITLHRAICHRQKVIPFDLVFSHKEQHYFPLHGDWKNKQASNKESTRYHHAESKCIMPRFPYFTNDYIEIPSEVRNSLQESHKVYM